MELNREPLFDFHFINLLLILNNKTMDNTSPIITSLCWVSRGFAKNVVEEYNPTKEELEEY